MFVEQLDCSPRRKQNLKNYSTTIPNRLRRCWDPHGQHHPVAFDPTVRRRDGGSGVVGVP